MYTTLDGKKFYEDQDTVPPVPPAARRLRPGEVLVRRWNGRGFDEWVERRRASSPLAAAASSPRPKTPRPGLGSLATPAPARGGERGYIILGRDEVPHRLRRAAESTLLWLRDSALGGHQPELFFFRAAGPGEEPSFTHPDDILGRASPASWRVGVRVEGRTTPWDVVETTAHEVGHLVGMSEGECEAFARKLALYR